MNIKNLTPHEIKIYATDRKTELLTVAPEGIIPRVTTTQEEIGKIHGIPMQKIAYGAVENLPAPAPDTVYIVSQMVLSALNGSRADLVAPDTGKGAVRDEAGRILGTTNFVTNTKKEKIIGYLVGKEWFSADQGDAPNNFEFPDKFIIDETEAMETFEKLKNTNAEWSFGYERAYIAEVYEDGTILERRYK